MLKKGYLPIFEKARLKLTAWYVLIIMLVSFTFTAFIYNGVSREFQNRLHAIENRLSIETPRGFRLDGPVHDYFINDLEAARNRIIIILLYANGFLFILSATLGNYLAGKTLEPLEDALEEQKRFAADASHELKTPLTALQTSIEVALRDKNLTLSEAKKTLRESLNDIDKLKTLSNNLLTLARVQFNGLDKDSVDIKGLTEKSIDKHLAIAKKKKIKIIQKLQSQEIEADPIKIEKMISILLDNAIKYTPKNGKITISLIPDKKKRLVTLKIKDTGVGISQEDIDKIFERFYRADTSRSKMKVEGFGLGLSLAKEIVDEHDGVIFVESIIDKGSTFTVKLPA